jgi:hypothetical protein
MSIILISHLDCCVDALQGVVLADFAADCGWPQVGAIRKRP